MDKAVNRKLKLLTFLLFKTKTDSALDLWLYAERKRTLGIFVYLFASQKERFFYIYDVEIYI